LKRKYKGKKRMSKPKKEKERVITLDGIEYKYDDMTEEQQILVNHVQDLDNKIGGAKWNLDQLGGGRDYFMEKLVDALGHVVPEQPEKAEPVEQ